MIQEALEYVEQQAIQRAEARIVKIPGEPNDVVYIDVPGKPLERRVCEAAPRNYTAKTLTGLCEQIKHFKDTGVCVFVGRGAVVASLGETTRREKITMPLEFSQPFKWLREAKDAGKSLNQKDLIWLLRSTFRNEVAPLSFCTDIRQIRIAGSADGESTVAVGSESLRKSVQASAAMAGGSMIPEQISFHSLVYEGIGEADTRQSFAVAVDLNLSTQQFLLKVLPGEVERAEIEAVNAISEFIRATCEGVTVFVDSSM